MDWKARTVSGPGGVDARWRITFCPGAAPVLCVQRDTGERGVVELLSFPASSINAFKDLSEGEALAHVARDNIRSVAADRATTCPPGYHAEPTQPHVAVVGGHPGVSWELAVVDRAGTVEREISYAARSGSRLYVIHAAGIGPTACLSREGEFSVAGLNAFAATLRSLVARSRLPAN